MPAKASEVKEARERLIEWLKPGDTVYIIVDHVSASGMSRNIRCVLLKYDEERKEVIDLHPNWAVQTVLGYRRAKKGDGFVVGGCGMDMGFHVVYSLGQLLFNDGYALKHRWL